MFTKLLYQAGALAAPSPEPGPGVSEIDTGGIVTFFGTVIAPILFAFLGVWIVSRATRGEAGRTMTSSAIALVGVAFIAGSGIWFTLANGLLGVIFK